MGWASPLLLAVALGPTAAPQDAEVVRGVVRERTSGAPVASYALRIRADGQEEGELVWTDAEGRFTSVRAYAYGERLRITKHDHPGLERLERTEYELTALDDAVDTIVRIDPERLPRAPVRPGAVPWVRFLPVRNDLSADRPWLLRVQRADGLRAAEVVRAPTRHASEAPLVLALVPTARLDVVVRVTGDALYFSWAAVQIECVSTGARCVLPATGRSEREEGVTEHLFRSTALAPGDYRVLVLDVLGDRQFVPQAEVTLVAGEARTVMVDIARGAAPQDD